LQDILKALDDVAENEALKDIDNKPANNGCKETLRLGAARHLSKQSSISYSKAQLQVGY
jgi:hypothetical protein